MNLEAGYIGDAVSDIFKKKFSNESIFIEDTKNKDILKLKGLLEIISNFNVSTNHNFDVDYANIPKILAVQNNIISRGLPTRSPLFLENLFVELGLSSQDETKLFEFKYNSITKYSYKSIFNKLHIIYPNLDIKFDEYLGELDSNLEKKFLQNSHPIFKQILQSQRELKTIVLQKDE